MAPLEAADMRPVLALCLPIREGTFTKFGGIASALREDSNYFSMEPPSATTKGSDAGAAMARASGSGGAIGLAWHRLCPDFEEDNSGCVTKVYSFSSGTMDSYRPRDV